MGSDESEDHVQDQHLVSEVLLKRWTEDGFLCALNLRHQGARAPAEDTRSVGYRKDYIREQAGPWEGRWAAIETRVPEALDAVDRDELHDSTALLNVVKDLMTLHWARSEVTSEAWIRSFSSEMATKRLMNVAEILQQPGALDALFEHFTGGLVSPGTGGAHAWTIDQVQHEWNRRLGPGGKAFAGQLGAHFERFREWLDGRGIEIGTAPDGAEFVISDAPVQLLDHSTRRVGVLGGVSLDQADTVLMPLTPHAVAAVAKDNNTMVLPRPALDSVNVALIASAHERIFFRPSSGLESWGPEDGQLAPRMNTAARRPGDPPAPPVRWPRTG